MLININNCFIIVGSLSQVGYSVKGIVNWVVNFGVGFARAFGAMPKSITGSTLPNNNVNQPTLDVNRLDYFFTVSPLFNLL